MQIQKCRRFRRGADDLDNDYDDHDHNDFITGFSERVDITDDAKIS